MPVRKQEAHRALELLEEYHTKLNRAEDKQLKDAIERIITIFKSRLFQALLDIQEFYEETLLNDSKSLLQKTSESNQIAAKWEANPPIVSPNGGLFLHKYPQSREETSMSIIKESNAIARSMHYQPSGGATDFPIRESPAATPTTPLGVRVSQNQPSIGSYQYSPATNDSWNEGQENGVGVRGTNSIDRQYGATTNGHHRQTNGHANPYAPSDEWEYEDIVLEKGTSGLGFSIAGGRDNPHLGAGDASICVTKVIGGGAAAHDGRLRKDDVILRVNTTDTVDVPHNVAVEALKRAGNVVKLFVKRKRGKGSTVSHTPTITPSPLEKFSSEKTERIELIKGNKGLGFSIAGGVGNEHIPGDTGIFVTKIIDGGAAQIDGRLQVGDKLAAVGNNRLEDVTHETAVAALRATLERVALTVVKNPHPEATAAAAILNLDTYERPPVVAAHQQHYNDAYQPSTLPRTSPQVIRPYEDVQQSYKPPSYTSPEISRSPRTITLQKGHAGLGFNIVGGEDGEGIYISYILPGGVADLSGSLFKGDQLLQVNEVDLRYGSHEMAAQALKNSGTRVNVVAQYKPEDYQRFEAKIEEIRNEMINQGTTPQNFPSPRKEMTVRALFDYDPSKDSGLPSRGLAFNYGDVLHVTNASDDEWWQAKRILSDRREEGYGIIPSKKRIEKRERTRRKQVNFMGSRQPSLSEKHTASKKSLSLSRKFPFMKSKEKMNEETDIDRLDEPIFSYEVVEEQRLNYVRPIVVLGPLKDRINDDLISEHPERYGSCVPHTSRPRKEHEADGRDYFFVERDAMERDIQNHLFIEAGQYNGNLYGTSVASVKNVAQQGKHCILDVSGNAIKRLQSASLYPIAILIKPNSWQQLMEWNRRLSDEEAQRQFQRAQMIEQEFGESFTSIIQGDTPEEVYAKAKEIIRDQSGPVVWVPSREQL